MRLPPRELYDVSVRVSVSVSARSQGPHTTVKHVFVSLRWLVIPQTRGLYDVGLGLGFGLGFVWVRVWVRF